MQDYDRTSTGWVRMSTTTARNGGDTEVDDNGRVKSPAVTSSDPPHAQIRTAVGRVCQGFPSSYWQDLDRERQYPEAFVAAMTASGLLGALVPKEFGGLGLSMTEASVIVEEVNRSGGNAGQCHAQMYVMGTLLRHGSEAQKRFYLPKIATGELRLQAFGVTEPDAGTDTTRISTTAERRGDTFVVNGEKVFISRVQHSDLMLLLVRTTPREQVAKRSHGLSLLLVDLREAVGNGMVVEPIYTMMNNETNRLEFHDLEVPAGNLVGEEGNGFRYLLDGVNAERILIAGECVGDGRWFIEQAAARAKNRQVFGRSIGQNQGVQFPLARAHVDIEAADLMRFRAAELCDRGEPCGAEANMAKLLAADASWQAANTAMQTFGGYAFDVSNDIERKFRETRLYQVAPISTNMILSYIAEHVLGLPRSF